MWVRQFNAEAQRRRGAEVLADGEWEKREFFVWWFGSVGKSKGWRFYETALD
jgi:hypothetical protein